MYIPMLFVRYRTTSTASLSIPTYLLEVFPLHSFNMSTSRGAFHKGLSDASTEVSPNMTPIRTSDDGDKLFPPATQDDLQEKTVQADAAEGGWKAWVQVFACFLIFFNTWGQLSPRGIDILDIKLTGLLQASSTHSVCTDKLGQPGILSDQLHRRFRDILHHPSLQNTLDHCMDRRRLRLHPRRSRHHRRSSARPGILSIPGGHWLIPGCPRTDDDFDLQRMVALLHQPGYLCRHRRCDGFLPISQRACQLLRA